ncbi:hypothetical protein FHR75_004180 [Kineococcus radiotolerans]|uniref:Uncharacterized protein n=1 Tax=Kineococcus radiotolerans TaxID=131568 RepID=A0A7W4TQP4_KINRA|nr:hypothetical protein [Kineococcus radiotolerans]MBB2903338.1 hypothetical protein [Kineococcus radiotolerans]
MATVRAWHVPLAWLVAAMAIWAVVCAFGLVLDGRMLGGAPIWAKPLKFTISFGLYGLTLAWMLSLISGARRRRVGWWAGTIAAAVAVLEIVATTVQVVRGTSSHFNMATPLDATLYAVMGVAVVVLYCATLVTGVFLAVFTKLPDRSLAWALRLGLLIAVAGLSVGFLMVLPTAQQLAAPEQTVIGSHSVGGDDASGGLFFLGWNTQHGDLRPAHFVGMHALQALPLLALALRTIATPRLSEGTRLRIVLLTAAAWSSLTGLVLWQALRGQSITTPDALTWATTGALTLAAIVCGAVISRRAHRDLRNHQVVAPQALHTPM